MNQVILLNKHPVGKPTLANFKFITEDMPVAGEGEVLLKTKYVSVDPYLRGRMSDTKSYVPSFELNKPIQSALIAEVMECGNNALFKKGDFLTGHLDWKEYQVSKGKGLTRIDAPEDQLTPYLGILGMTGLTAYLGLTEIGAPKPGETLVVSGAAGAVGSVVGQIGKLLGCTVVGITGSDKKAALLLSKFGFDQVVNYKTANLPEAVKKACPNGVDIYFDNVGGEISDAVLAHINKFARLPVCGTIALYNETKMPMGPRLQTLLVIKSALMKGFIISDYYEKFPVAQRQLAVWLKEGKLSFQETVVEGFNNIPAAFMDLFEGKNEGKMIVKI
ncbi:MAG TPA: NADP-dependent oxidoreductase [Bacteroidia bacterium]|jgi:NADPH-dependent curcumin reductase CurA|nr:NADP-dependent oxidoreductase [Bacteroidia bacterium]